jgi:hypothetical protein
MAADVDGYMVWTTYRRDPSVPSAELRVSGSAERTIVDSATLEMVFSGCYDSSEMQPHCILPWSFYEVFVVPIVLGCMGAVSSVVVRTEPGLPVAPSQLEAVRIVSAC